MKNEKKALAQTRAGLLTYKMKQLNHTTAQNQFQYHCDFCAVELLDGGNRFDGIGSCSRCHRLAHRLVDALKAHWANYFNNLGVKK
jgi:hypothetical protein